MGVKSVAPIFSLRLNAGSMKSSRNRKLTSSRILKQLEAKWKTKKILYDLMYDNGRVPNVPLARNYHDENTTKSVSLLAYFRT